VTDEELERLAQRLGVRAADRLVVERTAEAVVTRLRRQPRSWMGQGSGWLKIAAAALLVLGVGVVARAPWRGRPPVAVAVVPLGEDLSGLSAAELREAIAALDLPLADEGGAETGLEGLSAAELRALLRSLEG